MPIDKQLARPSFDATASEIRCNTVIEWPADCMGRIGPPHVPWSVLSSCIASILRRSVWRLVFPLIDMRSAAHELHPLQRLDLA